MAQTRPELLQTFLASCRSWYDICETPAESGLPLAATCVFHSRQEKFVLSKKAKLWGIESNEYMYVFTVPELTPELVKRCTDFALADALPQVKPHSEHMYSYITAVFLADVMQSEALRAVKRSRFFKSYRCTLYGSSSLRTVAVDLERKVVVTNPNGRESGKFFRKAVKE